MKKLIIVMIGLFVVACACSANKDGAGLPDGSSGQWDHGSGYVVAKEGGRLLIVSEKVDGEVSLENLLVDVSPNAIWLAVEQESYEAVQIGDQVRMTIKGAIAESYPEQATGSVEIIK
ncbi:DUF3221 domain-containing protein [Paenibacillus sp. LHD-117]|uniref:DUF3221 domain-containing protein n=1 Tax=Paenibacillus sp. LHD-117 TaxID=3071412 RepID=UPI0027E1A779|nr:DUF3221 domain-containing protein [Paenibacillus sp. LHD-117]MDQ6420000.1 DUF3221 domain-containing protein [Paenibacillus sp. LHD-117]